MWQAGCVGSKLHTLNYGPSGTYFGAKSENSPNPDFTMLLPLHHRTNRLRRFLAVFFIFHGKSNNKSEVFRSASCPSQIIKLVKSRAPADVTATTPEPRKRRDRRKSNQRCMHAGLIMPSVSTPVLVFFPVVIGFFVGDIAAYYRVRCMLVIATCGKRHTQIKPQLLKLSISCYNTALINSTYSF